MCGFSGFITTRDFDGEQLRATAQTMACTLINRGPDDSGEYVDASSGVALGFRRLSIVDLSPEGHQPMESATRRYAITFNGEIYNFLQLRDELEAAGHRFRGHSDTEVLLAAFTEWGIDATLRKCNGMFGFAVWDRQEKTLTIARDRIGKKPVYYGWCGRSFLFGSELKALAVHPDFDATIDRDALAHYLRFGYVPGPHSIYRKIAKLTPGSYATVRRGDTAMPRVVRYWSARDAALAGENDQFRGSESEAIDQLDRLLRDAVGLRMIADVPLGAFLSGGIDSSTVVAMMQAQSSKPVRTFSIGFREDEFNEAQHAMKVAKHLGTDHTELYVSAQETLDVIPKLPTFYDEPFADSSQVPTFLVSQLARRHVTVALVRRWRR
jgi:asparagine synthase (glutamine-hydrolysing)